MTTIASSRFQQLIEKNQVRLTSRRKATNALMLGITGFMVALDFRPI